MMPMTILIIGTMICVPIILFFYVERRSKKVEDNKWFKRVKEVFDRITE